MEHIFNFREKEVTVFIDLVEEAEGKDEVKWYLRFVDEDGLLNEYSIGTYPTHEGQQIKVGYAFLLMKNANQEILKSYQDHYYEKRLAHFYRAYPPAGVNYGDWAGMQAINGLIARLPAFEGSKEKSDFGYRIFDANGTFFQPIVFDVAITEETSDEQGVGQADGTLVVSVVNGSGGYEYSLDGDTYQASSTFDELPAGDYIVYVRDQAGVIRYKPVNLPGETTEL